MCSAGLQALCCLSVLLDCAVHTAHAQCSVSHLHHSAKHHWKMLRLLRNTRTHHHAVLSSTHITCPAQQRCAHLYLHGHASVSFSSTTAASHAVNINSQQTGQRCHLCCPSRSLHTTAVTPSDRTQDASSAAAAKSTVADSISSTSNTSSSSSLSTASPTPPATPPVRKSRSVSSWTAPVYDLAPVGSRAALAAAARSRDNKASRRPDVRVVALETYNTLLEQNQGDPLATAVQMPFWQWKKLPVHLRFRHLGAKKEGLFSIDDDQLQIQQQEEDEGEVEEDHSNNRNERPAEQYAAAEEYDDDEDADEDEYDDAVHQNSSSSQASLPSGTPPSLHTLSTSFFRVPATIHRILAFERDIIQESTRDNSETGEICLVGRSNVGKSSLLNALLKNGGKMKQLAATGKLPGKTKMLFMFSWKEDRNKRIVDW